MSKIEEENSQLVTLAVEELGGYLQRKRNKALNKALEQLEFRVGLTYNMMHQLEVDLYYLGNLKLIQQNQLSKHFKA